MEIINQHLVTILVFLPLAGALFVLLFLPGTQKEAIRWATFLTMLAMVGVLTERTLEIALGEARHRR